MNKTKSTNSAVTPDEVFSSAESKVEVREIHHYHKDEQRIEKRITGALTMITIGLILLLNTTGNLSWSVWWEFIKFWPMFIVSAGIQLMLSFSRITKIIGEFIGLFIFITLIFFAAINTNSGMFANSGMFSLKTDNNFPFFFTWPRGEGEVVAKFEVNSLDFTDVASQDVEIKQGVGEFVFSSSTDNAVLFNAFVKSNHNDDGIDAEKKLVADKLNIKVISTHSNRWSFSKQAPYYEYKALNTLPISKLAIDLGAGKGTVNLDNGLMIDEFKGVTGAGEMLINIADNAAPKNLDLEVGAGNMVLTLSKDIAYEVSYKVGVGNAEIAGMQNRAGFGEKGTYRSSNWEEAAAKTSVKVDVGVGNFELLVK